MGTIHDVRDHFVLEDFLRARELTQEAVGKIQKLVKIGMNEADGHEIVQKVLDEMGAKKKWHPTKFRIGVNTTKSFRDSSEPDVELQSQDLFFVDIGPVWGGYEGDYGETFVVGDSTQHHDIKAAAYEVFKRTRDTWRENDTSGAELYSFAEAQAQSLGYQMNTRMKGHRLGDFPHHLFYKGGMSETEESPCNHLWVLEIHLLDQEKRFGAFYEDVLQK